MEETPAQVSELFSIFPFFWDERKWVSALFIWADITGILILMHQTYFRDLYFSPHAQSSLCDLKCSFHKPIEYDITRYPVTQLIWENSQWIPLTKKETVSRPRSCRKELIISSLSHFFQLKEPGAVTYLIIRSHPVSFHRKEYGLIILLSLKWLFL
jgi:hypothetical protein